VFLFCYVGTCLLGVMIAWVIGLVMSCVLVTVVLSCISGSHVDVVD